MEPATQIGMAPKVTGLAAFIPYLMILLCTGLSQAGTPQSGARVFTGTARLLLIAIFTRPGVPDVAGTTSAQPMAYTVFDLTDRLNLGAYKGGV